MLDLHPHHMFTDFSSETTFMSNEPCFWYGARCCIACCEKRIVGDNLLAAHGYLAEPWTWGVEGGGVCIVIRVCTRAWASRVAYWHKILPKEVCVESGVGYSGYGGHGGYGGYGGYGSKLESG